MVQLLNNYFALITTVIIIMQDNNYYLCQIIQIVNYGTDLSNTPVNRIYTYAKFLFYLINVKSR